MPLSDLCRLTRIDTFQWLFRPNVRISSSCSSLSLFSLFWPNCCLSSSGSSLSLPQFDTLINSDNSCVAWILFLLVSGNAITFSNSLALRWCFFNFGKYTNTRWFLESTSCFVFFVDKSPEGPREEDEDNDSNICCSSIFLVFKSVYGPLGMRKSRKGFGFSIIQETSVDRNFQILLKIQKSGKFLQAETNQIKGRIVATVVFPAWW